VVRATPPKACSGTSIQFSATLGRRPRNTQEFPELLTGELFIHDIAPGRKAYFVQLLLLEEKKGFLLP